jgi:PAS domain S-box-containing protein
MVSDRLKYLSRIFLIALFYFIAARLSLYLQFQNSNASPVWPPSGIALAAFIVYGRRIWPGIFIGALAANITSFLSNDGLSTATYIIASFCIAGGNTLEALAGNYLLKNKNYILGLSSRSNAGIESSSYFQGVNNVFWFLYSALIMCLVSAIVGTSSLFFSGIILSENFMAVAFTWWVGDVSGILVVTPLLIAWLKPSPKSRWKNIEPISHPLIAGNMKTEEIIETVALFIALSVMSGIIFYGWLITSFTLSRAFFIIPLMVWAALRFRLRVITSAITLIAGIAVLGTLGQHGPFISGAMNESLITASSFIAVVSITTLALQAVLNERRNTENELRIAQGQLRTLVKEGSVKIEDFEGRIKNLQSVMQNYGHLDFSERAPITGREDEIDAIARGLNKMAEEMETLRAAEKFYVKNIRETEERFRLLVENIKDYAIFMMDANGHISSWNKGAEQLKGYTSQEILGKSFSIFYTPDELANNEPSYNLNKAAKEGHYETEGWRLRKDGSLFFAHVSITALYDNQGHVKGFAKITRDITRRIEAEEALMANEQNLRSVNDFLDKILENIPNMIFVKDAEELRFVRFNKAGEKLIGVSRDDLIGKNDYDFFPKEQADFFTSNDKDVILKGELNDIPEEPIDTKTGRRWLHTKKIPIFNEEGKAIYLLGISEDITERRKIQAELAQKQAEVEKNRQFLLDSQSVGKIGSWERSLTDNEITASPEYFKMLDIEPHGDKTSFQEFLTRLHPEDRQRVKDTIETIKEQGGQYDIEYRIVKKDGQQRIIWAKGKAVQNTEGSTQLFRGTTQDITDRKESENQLTQLAEELSRSNKELEQFAYVASHDLQEPLRIVTSYVQLLQRRFSKNLDKESDEFMNFIVEAVGRMRSLIQDLLTYSRVGTQIKPFSETDSNRAVQIALDNLAASLDESRAEISVDPLPTVTGDDSQIVRLFQNLIGNAIKFRSDKPLKIKISAEDRKSEVLFSIKDNGIGISAEYKDRIFVIFQRLNDRAKYPGTGIGLAICKKIVELHGGRIWMEPNKGGGSAFYFTIKK